MKITNLLRILGLFLLVTACEDSELSRLVDGGIGGTGSPVSASSAADVSVGPITGFGSIFVNGVEYDTSVATITVNEQFVTEDQLKLGMVVQVEGSIDSEGTTGVANQVTFHENVVGPLQSIDETNNSLVVLGQTVIIDQLTLFEGFTDITTLRLGDILEISGLTNEVGNILATRIAVLAGKSRFAVRGRPHHFDPMTKTMIIGNLAVDISQFSLLEPPDRVDIQGQFVGNQFIVDHFEIPEKMPSKGISRVQLQGIITQFNTPLDFEVDHTPVTVNSTTQFRFGNETDLALGIHVKIAGYYNDQAILVARQVTFFSPNHYPRMGIQADIEALDIDNNQLNLLGITLQWTQDRLIQDRRDNLPTFHLNDLRIGDRIEVRGFVDLSLDEIGTPIIERLRRQKTDSLRDEVWLEGHPNTIAVETRTFNLFGVDIRVDDNACLIDKPKSPCDDNIVEFFSQLQTVKPLIRVRGQWLGHGVAAKRIVILPKHPPPAN